MQTYSVSPISLSELEAHVHSLAQLARNLDVTAPTIEVSSKISELIVNDSSGIPTGRARLVYEIQLNLPSNEINGWHIVALVTRGYDSDRERNEVVSFGDDKEDASWRELQDVCDHCGDVRRKRKTLIVIKNSASVTKVVGSTCLHSFLGKDSPEKIATWTEKLAKLKHLADRLENESRAHFFNLTCYDPAYFLAGALIHARSADWVTREQSRASGASASVEVVVDLLNQRAKNESFALDVTETELRESRIIIDNARNKSKATVAHRVVWKRSDLEAGANLIFEQLL